jgi:RND family efflux transporter MFP subunit
LLLAGCGKHERGATPTSPLPAAEVRVARIEAKTYTATEEVVGTVRAKLRASLEARISGRILEMPVVAGQAVKEGDLIASLDAREVQARLDQAKAVRDQAERDRSRYEALLKEKTISQAESDASVKEAEAMMGYAKVTAPFPGVISRKLVDVGDLTPPGRALVELEDPKALRLETDVPEALIDRIQLGAKMKVKISSLQGDLEAVVSEAAPAADPNSRTFRVKLDLPTVPGVRLGQFGRVVVPVGETTTPRVPVSALVQRGQMEMVFVVADQKAQMRLVKSGKRIGNEIELVSGVIPGEPVVIEGAATLLDGQPVQLK